MIEVECDFVCAETQYLYLYLPGTVRNKIFNVMTWLFYMVCWKWQKAVTFINFHEVINFSKSWIFYGIKNRLGILHHTQIILMKCRQASGNILMSLMLLSQILRWSRNSGKMKIPWIVYVCRLRRITSLHSIDM